LGEQLWRKGKQSDDHASSEKSRKKNYQGGAPNGVKAYELDLNNVCVGERKAQHNQKKQGPDKPLQGADHH
jgi:hypothetical protein